jgi:hypothetical protein
MGKVNLYISISVISPSDSYAIEVVDRDALGVDLRSG